MHSTLLTGAMLVTLSLPAAAAIADFTGIKDERLREIAFDLDQKCRGASFQYESSKEFICTLREEAWEEMDQRGYCYYQGTETEWYPECKE
jgi:hypothetical protein